MTTTRPAIPTPTPTPTTRVSAVPTHGNKNRSRSKSKSNDNDNGLSQSDIHIRIDTDSSRKTGRPPPASSTIQSPPLSRRRLARFLTNSKFAEFVKQTRHHIAKQKTSLRALTRQATDARIPAHERFHRDVHDLVKAWETYLDKIGKRGDLERLRALWDSLPVWLRTTTYHAISRIVHREIDAAYTSADNDHDTKQKMRQLGKTMYDTIRRHHRLGIWVANMDVNKRELSLDDVVEWTNRIESVLSQDRKVKAAMDPIHDVFMQVYCFQNVGFFDTAISKPLLADGWTRVLTPPQKLQSLRGVDVVSFTLNATGQSVSTCVFFVNRTARHLVTCVVIKNTPLSLYTIERGLDFVPSECSDIATTGRGRRILEVTVGHPLRLKITNCDSDAATAVAVSNARHGLYSGVQYGFLATRKTRLDTAQRIEGREIQWFLDKSMRLIRSLSLPYFNSDDSDIAVSVKLFDIPHTNINAWLTNDAHQYA